MLGFLECHHAQLELQWLDSKRLISERIAISNALQQHSIEEVMRFDAASNEQLPLTQAGYCRNCGRFEKLNLFTCPQTQCKRLLSQEIDYESVCVAFHRLGLDLALD